ncbi:Hypothetical predicted protein [Cloeon dipterum]|uniref:Uncharacterized protein n=1 Tax=Cloeon dipterum TaxID=197152 RepID=A0A8S1D3W8_9INSE|nr:Hypothetical predicted protein [Cloeon dipterum]
MRSVLISFTVILFISAVVMDVSGAPSSEFSPYKRYRQYQTSFFPIYYPNNGFTSFLKQMRSLDSEFLSKRSINPRDNQFWTKMKKDLEFAAPLVVDHPTGAEAEE